MTEIDVLLGDLLDAQSRQHIADAWAQGKIPGDVAMYCLLDLELIEHSEP